MLAQVFPTVHVELPCPRIIFPSRYSAVAAESSSISVHTISPLRLHLPHHWSTDSSNIDQQFISQSKSKKSMAAIPPLVIGLRALFLLLGCAMVATLIYTIYIDGLPFRTDLLTPWMVATLVDYYINLVPLAAWVVYKEGLSLIWILLLICLGSVTTCVYILIQLLKLSPQESLQDPIYHVLLRNSSTRTGTLHSHHVITARVIFSILGILMLVTLLYTIFTDGSPFRKQLLTPWLSATLIDFYINVAALSIWVIYKESSWISAGIWVLMFICFGSISTCAYIVKELFQLSTNDPIYLVLFNNQNRKVRRSTFTCMSKLGDP